MKHASHDLTETELEPNHEWKCPCVNKYSDAVVLPGFVEKKGQENKRQGEMRYFEEVFTGKEGSCLSNMGSCEHHTIFLFVPFQEKLYTAHRMCCDCLFAPHQLFFSSYFTYYNMTVALLTPHTDDFS